MREKDQMCCKKRDSRRRHRERDIEMYRERNKKSKRGREKEWNLMRRRKKYQVDGETD